MCILQWPSNPSQSQIQLFPFRDSIIPEIPKFQFFHNLSFTLLILRLICLLSFFKFFMLSSK